MKCGLSSVTLNSSWRQQRLVILCYHGISLEDEHLWAPELYVEASQLRERFEYLRQERCNVLGLDEAVQRLYKGTLPKRAVAITFDDGAYDFYRLAFPILRELELESTVYLTTYYSDFNRPVFDVMSSYLLWKARGQTLELPAVLAYPVVLNPMGRTAMDRAIKQYARRNNLSAGEKDQFLSCLAQHLNVDYEALCRRRILHIMTPAEVKDVADAGIDIQLHTHRHRVSQRQNLFNREIDENRERIAAVSAAPLRHFCYPGGFHLPEFPVWLERCGIKSATTCKPGIASRRSNPFLLPRLVDSSLLTTTEFASWISGLAAMLPQRPHVMSSDQLLEQGA
jgi:peptidoglycan/xylan/chitin deacetylase (PgdA/CDA1 family)